VKALAVPVNAIALRGRKVDAAPNQNIENNPMQSRKGSLAWMLARENILTRRANHRHYSKYRGVG
jgi:hypothetical protein